MGERPKKYNPCACCGESWEAHQPGWSDGDLCAAYNCTYQEQRIFRASPSSVKTYGGTDKDPGCKRRWAAKALGGIKKETPAQAFGTKLHGYAEAYLQFGTVPDQMTPEGRLMVEGIPFLPKRRLAEDEVEGEISFELGGVQWIGYYDWRENDVRLIGDHKSSADPKKWGLTSDQLQDDLQACMYSFGTGWDETRLKWVYYAKKSKTAYPVEATVTHAQALRVMEKHVPIAQEMQRWFNEYPEQQSIDELNAIPCNPAACGYTGRNCDFSEHCTLINPSSLVRNKEIPNMANDRIAELRAKIEAKKNGGVVNPPESAAALEETAKEVKNDPSDPAANADTGKPVEAAEKIETTIVPSEAAKEKIKASRTVKVPTGAVDSALVAFLATLPSGSTVQITVNV